MCVTRSGSASSGKALPTAKANEGARGAGDAQTPEGLALDRDAIAALEPGGEASGLALDRDGRLALHDDRALAVIDDPEAAAVTVRDDIAGATVDVDSEGRARLH